jgi:hypothetical protein
VCKNDSATKPHKMGGEAKSDRQNSGIFKQKQTNRISAS